MQTYGETGGQTDRHDANNSRFSKFCERPQNCVFRLHREFVCFLLMSRPTKIVSCTALIACLLRGTD